MALLDIIGSTACNVRIQSKISKHCLCGYKRGHERHSLRQSHSLNIQSPSSGACDINGSIRVRNFYANLCGGCRYPESLSHSHRFDAGLAEFDVLALLEDVKTLVIREGSWL
jgi:hypothetical protein